MVGPGKTLVLQKVGAIGAFALALLGASTAQADVAPNHVRDVKVRPLSGVTDGVEIDVSGTAATTYSARTTQGGQRLEVDLGHSDIAGAPSAITAKIGVVGGVLTQQFKADKSPFTRVSVNLTKAASYRVRVEGSSVKILVFPQGANVKEPPATSKATGAEPQGSTATAKEEISEVRDVRFERLSPTVKDCAPSGCDRVVVALSQLGGYSLGRSPAGKPRLELRDVSLPEKLARTLDVTAYKGPLRAVSTFADAKSKRAFVEIDGAGDGTLSIEGQSLVWSFPTKAAPTSKEAGSRVGKDGKPVRRSVTVAREPEHDAPKVSASIRDSATETVEGGEAGYSSSVGGSRSGRRYGGRRIDLDLKDADIHNILRLLADVGRVNIVTADDVQGSITIRMRAVPWDQALDVILQAKGLGMVRQGNLIRVAPMAALQKQRELELAKLKQEYEMTPLETRIIPVSYAQASELQHRAKDLLSPRGSIAVDERTNVLIARDISGNLNHVEELVRTLDTQTPQVLVEARIVEATSRYQRDIGIQWGGDASFSAATGNSTGLAFPSKVSMAGGASDGNTPTAGLSPFTNTVTTPNFAVNLPAAVGAGAGGAMGFSLGSLDNNFNLNLRLSAAELSGLLRVVSSPRILTLNNREARINQGTLIPFSQVSALGVQTTFQEAKLQLLVKPHVTADGSVSMHVKITRDEPDFNQTSARGEPTILKREAETDLLVPDGHTAVIGGIYTRNTGRNLDQVPFFGDIPILGLLFQRRRASDTRNELVIFITPRIVNRAESLGR